MAASEEVSTDAAIAAVVSELDKISSLKVEQRTALKAILLLLTGFSKSFI